MTRGGGRSAIPNTPTAVYTQRPRTLDTVAARHEPFDGRGRMRMPTNPDTIAWLCPACGKKTRANLRTGLAFSHNRPGSTTACDLSAAAVLAPSIDGPAPELAPPEPSPQQSAPRRYFDGPSSSVRAIPSGAPGGSRRH